METYGDTEMQCEQETGSIAWYIFNGYGGGKKMKRRFWNVLAALPPATIATLRAIYVKYGEYNNIPKDNDPVPCHEPDNSGACDCDDFGDSGEENEVVHA